jgi:hypothetical protein
MGDAGVMSGLIATNHDELEELKHKGDRNYFEFTLQKGAPRRTVGTIKLQLKKVDVKHSKYHPRRQRGRQEHREEGQEPG